MFLPSHKSVELYGSFDVAPADITIVDDVDGEVETKHVELSIQNIREALRTGFELESGASLHFQKLQRHNKLDRHVAKKRNLVPGRTTVRFSISLHPLGNDQRHPLLRSAGNLSNVTVENICQILSQMIIQPQMSRHFKSHGIKIVTAESIKVRFYMFLRSLLYSIFFVCVCAFCFFGFFL